MGEWPLGRHQERPSQCARGSTPTYISYASERPCRLLWLQSMITGEMLGFLVLGKRSQLPGHVTAYRAGRS